MGILLLYCQPPVSYTARQSPGLTARYASSVGSGATVGEAGAWVSAGRPPPPLPPEPYPGSEALGRAVGPLLGEPAGSSAGAGLRRPAARCPRRRSCRPPRPPAAARARPTRGRRPPVSRCRAAAAPRCPRLCPDPPRPTRCSWLSPENVATVLLFGASTVSCRIASGERCGKTCLVCDRDGPYRNLTVTA